MSQRLAPQAIQAALPADAVVLLHGRLHVHLGRSDGLDPARSDSAQLGASRLPVAFRVLQHDWITYDTVDVNG